MTNRNQTRSSRAVLAALAISGCFCFVGNARATLIVPGAAAQSTPGAGTFAGLTLIASESFTVTAYDVSSNPRYTATVESEVLKSPGGTLDFAYQVTNLVDPEPDSIHTVSITSYRNFTTDVDYVSSTGAVTYDTVQRPSLGGGIPLSFDYTPTANAIGPGEATDWIIVKTNATVYDNSGTTTLIDGATAYVTSYEAAVPEPVTSGLIASGAVALLAARPRRRNPSGSN